MWRAGGIFGNFVMVYSELINGFPQSVGWVFISSHNVFAVIIFQRNTTKEVKWGLLDAGGER